ncbi:AAA family ATPase [bacterium]|nr:AAA family ATPase [bacterium]
MNKNQAPATLGKAKLPIQEKEEAKYPQFVLDVPSTKDDLGGPHDRLAETLNRLIRNSTAGGSVCLRGPRGAGKTTTVQLLEKKLTSPDIFVFQFDSWAHEGANLRAEFLASLITQLLDRGWLGDTEQWRKEREVILGKLKITTNAVAKGLTLQLLILYFAIHYVSRMSDPFKSGFDWFNTPSILLWITEVIALIGITVYLCRRDWWQKLKAFLKWQTLTQTHERKSLDISSAVFEDYFWKIVTAVSKRNVRRLVVVLDNADRLAIKEIEQMLSVIKILLPGRETPACAAAANLWFVVPWWTENQENRDQEITKASQKALAETLPPSFDKLFQVVLDVPPCMTVASWGYLSRLIEQAFGTELFKQKQIELDHCSQIFQLKHLDDVRSFSPREAKRFVNYLVAGYLQWQMAGSHVALGSLALYYFVGEEIRSKPQLLQSEVFPDEKLKGIAARLPWKTDFHSLLFLTESEQSAHSLMYNLILDSISKRTTITILNYASLDNVGPLVCRAIQQYLDLNPNLPSALLCCTHALNTLEGILIAEKDNGLPMVWNHCTNYLRAITNWYQLTKTVVAPLLEVIDSETIQNRADLAERVICSIERNESQPGLPDFLAGLELLVKGLLDRELIVSERRIILPASAEVYRVIRDLDLVTLKNQGDPSISLDQVLIQSNIIDNIDDSYYRLILKFRERIELCDWTGAIAYIEDELTSKNDIQVSSWRSCLKILLLLAASEVPGSLELITRLKVEHDLQLWIQQNRETSITAGVVILAAVLVDSDESFLLELCGLSGRPAERELCKQIMQTNTYITEAIQETATLARQLGLVETIQNKPYPDHLAILKDEILTACSREAETALIDTY